MISPMSCNVKELVCYGQKSIIKVDLFAEKDELLLQHVSDDAPVELFTSLPCFSQALVCHLDGSIFLYDISRCRLISNDSKIGSKTIFGFSST